MKYQSKYEEMMACTITREALKMFKNSNTFIHQIDLQWGELFNKPVRNVSFQQALMLGTTAILIKNPIVSRRFWNG